MMIIIVMIFDDRIVNLLSNTPPEKEPDLTLLFILFYDVNPCTFLSHLG